VEQLLFFGVAIIAGAINSVAGGGSFLLFPVLMFGGLSPVSANVMCSVGMWPGSIASTYAYAKEIRTPFKTLRALVILSLIGGGIGSWILLHFPEQTFEALVPWLLLGATLIFTFGRKLVAKLRLEHATMPKGWVYFLMLVIAIYGGYFGAGMGILMLAMLQLMGHSHMHEMNGLKMMLSGAINAVAVCMFLISGEIVWQYAAVMVVGGIIGGYAGSRLALKVEPEKVRRFVVVLAAAMTAYFFLVPV